MRRIDLSHAAIEAALCSLEGLVERGAARRPQADDCRDAQHILDCFGCEAPEHHREEERRLYPELRTLAARAGRPELASTLYELEMEHERMERLYDESLRPALQAIARGEAAELSREAVAHLAWLYRRHIGMEDQVVVPLERRRP